MKAIELLEEYWQDNVDELEYMGSDNPELDKLLKENEVLQDAIKILQNSKMQTTKHKRK